jgi:hypothetical protein
MFNPVTRLANDNSAVRIGAARYFVTVDAISLVLQHNIQLLRPAGNAGRYKQYGEDDSHWYPKISEAFLMHNWPLLPISTA